MIFLEHLVAPPSGGVVDSIPGSASACLVSALEGPRLVLTANDADSARWGRDLSLFCTVRDLPLPAVILSPDEATPGERIESFRRALSADVPVVVASCDLATTAVPDVKGFDAAALTLRRQEEIEPAFLVDLLAELGYRRVSIVAAPGEFALRGGILDIFCSGTVDLPLRVEFFGDQVDSIRLFEVDSQRSVRSLEAFVVPPARESRTGLTLLEAFASRAPVTALDESALPAGVASDPRLLRLSTLAGGGDGLFLPLGGFGITAEERKAADEPVERALKRIRDLGNTTDVLLVCSSLGEAERTRDLMRDADMIAPIVAPERVARYEGSIAITTGDISGGFRLADPPGVVMSSEELFGARAVRRRAHRKSRVAGLLSSLDELSDGDFVVHEEHGVGRYLGLRRLDTGEFEDDVLVVQYAGGDLLYLPISGISRLRAYHGAGGSAPRVDSLGGKSWKKTRSRVKKRVKEMAAELVRLYATRARIQGHAFSRRSPLYDEFVDAFPYEETPDQLKAEDEIFQAMESSTVMDRLLCGDVGYGKTEVAMRAAFKAVADGKQVAVLVPTTILAEQHFETFSARFSPFPVKVDYLSRFKTAGEQKKTLGRVAAAETDIVIGTHRLLAKDVNLPNLGLLIVDEEHKFGVTHKERLQQMTAQVDVLTLSATPIPRTLHMALSGIRGISTIETPPEERMAVKTMVARHGDQVIREALEREFQRGGQVYYVHNRVETIYRVGKKLEAMFPGKRLGVAHGQMPERQLEGVMHAFFHGASDILLCTSIIGSGLDVPRANTIVIDRADMFGLADLYQLRGRVGRSDVRAYAYLLIPGENIVTDEARERLQAIRELSYLGAGFRLAMKDLEIRGAGNLLGAEQSGHIDAVGFDMYAEMLEEAINELQGTPPRTRLDPAVDLPVEARIPESYLEDSTLRFTFYRRLGSVENRQALEDIGRELVDRFGPYPEEVSHLLDVVGLKVSCRNAGIPALRWKRGAIHVEIPSDGSVQPDRLVRLAGERPGLVRFVPDGGLFLTVPAPKREKSAKKGPQPKTGPPIPDWPAIHGAALDFLEAMGPVDKPA